MPLHPIDPIYLWDGYVSRGLVDVEGAARFLVNRWPEVKGSAYREAALACREAMSGTGSAEDAREALIAAAESAGILDRKAMAAAVTPPRPGAVKHWRPRV